MFVRVCAGRLASVLVACASAASASLPTSDGHNPRDGLIADVAGNRYGTTSRGSSSTCRVLNHGGVIHGRSGGLHGTTDLTAAAPVVCIRAVAAPCLSCTNVTLDFAVVRRWITFATRLRARCDGLVIFTRRGICS